MLAQRQQRAGLRGLAPRIAVTEEHARPQTRAALPELDVVRPSSGLLLVDEDRRLASCADHVLADDALPSRSSCDGTSYMTSSIALSRMARRPRAPAFRFERFARDRLAGAVGELELDAVHLEQLLVLLHERVLRLA